jgi:oligopeptide/dipeptide ABC transporter ATP-binding protein
MDSKPTATLLSVANLKQHFRLNRSWADRLFFGQRWVYAVDGISLEIGRGETVGLIGESGSGKSTFGRALMLLPPPTDGAIWYQGKDITRGDVGTLKTVRQRFQMVFQNPYAAVNRRFQVADIVAEPLKTHGWGSRSERLEKTVVLLEQVGLSESFLWRYPHQLSGGQLQRVGIARSLALSPEFIIADEPTASVDVSVRAQIVNLLADLKRELQLTLLFISHDLSTISYIADRIAVMYLGRVVEIGPKTTVESRSLHPYTQALIQAVPRSDPEQRREKAVPLGEIPSAIDPPKGCHYHPRCQCEVEICRQAYPPLVEVADNHFVACYQRP